MSMLRRGAQSVWIGLFLSACGHHTTGGQTECSFQIDPAHTGFIASKLELPLTVAWERKLPIDSAVAAPLVTGGMTLVVSGLEWIGPKRLLAIDNETGTDVWPPIALPESANFGIAVANGIVVASTHDGKALAFDQKTGKPLWSVATGDDIDVNAPVAASGRVILSSGFSSGLWGHDLRTGQRLWSGAAGLYGVTPPVIASNFVAAEDQDGIVAGLDLGTGRTAWHASVESRLDGSLVASYRDVVYVRSSSGGIVALSLSTGAPTGWTTTSDAVPAFSQNSMITVSASAGVVSAVALGTPKVLWSFNAGKPIDMPPLVVGSHVFVVSSEGKLLSVNASSGTEEWSSDAIRVPVGREGTTIAGLGSDGEIVVLPESGGFIAFHHEAAAPAGGADGGSPDAGP